jgi:bacterioferritin (cytochrome b1)
MKLNLTSPTRLAGINDYYLHGFLLPNRGALDLETSILIISLQGMLHCGSNRKYIQEI